MTNPTPSVTNPILSALTEARNTFDRYARQHAAKWQTVASDPVLAGEAATHWDKYASNAALAEKMRAAIKYVEQNTSFIDPKMNEPLHLFQTEDELASHFCDYLPESETTTADVLICVSSPKKMKVSHDKWEWVD